MHATPPGRNPPSDPTFKMAIDDRRASGLLALVDLTRRLAAEMDLERILTLITNEACRAMDCERASLYLYDPERNELYTKIVTELEIDVSPQSDTGDDLERITVAVDGNYSTIVSWPFLSDFLSIHREISMRQFR